MIPSGKLNCLNIGIMRPKFGNGSGGGFCAEFQTVYDSWTTKPADADATELNTMVEKMVADGAWAIPDVWYNFAVHTNGASEALVNWINPGTNDATLVNAPAFVAFEGFTGANTKYINSHYNPNTEGVNFTLDDASTFGYIRIVTTSGVGVSWGCQNAGGDRCFFIPRLPGNNSFHALNAGTSDTWFNAPAYLGINILQRINATTHEWHVNKTLRRSAAKVSSAIPSFDIYMLANDNNGAAASYEINEQLSCWGAGSQFTTGNRDDLVDAFEAWMDYKGKGVVP